MGLNVVLWLHFRSFTIFWSCCVELSISFVRYRLKVGQNLGLGMIYLQNIVWCFWKPTNTKECRDMSDQALGPIFFSLLVYSTDFYLASLLLYFHDLYLETDLCNISDPYAVPLFSAIDFCRTKPWLSIYHAMSLILFCSWRGKGNKVLFATIIQCTIDMQKDVIYCCEYFPVGPLLTLERNFKNYWNCPEPYHVHPE